MYLKMKENLKKDKQKYVYISKIRQLRVVYSGVDFEVHRLLPEDPHNYCKWNNECCLKWNQR